MIRANGVGGPEDVGLPGRLAARLRPALGDWTRAAVVAMPVCVLAAVAAGRQGPSWSGAVARVVVEGGPVLINGGWWGEEGGLLREFDPARATLTTPECPPGLLVRNARVAPWVDGRGFTQVASTWARHPDDPVGVDDATHGLLRYELPGGRVLDRIPIDLMLSGAPCWFPDRTARVLATSADGRLYRVDFEGPNADRTARPVGWKVNPPWEQTRISDMAWPTSPRWGGRLFASLGPASLEMLAPGEDRHQVWWLELDPSGLEIVAAGRVTRPDPAGPADERGPSLALTDGGRPALAYVRRPLGREDWELCVAELALGPTTGAPRVRPSSVRVLAGSCGAIPPVFDLDGRALFGLRHPNTRSARMERFALPAALVAPTLAGQDDRADLARADPRSGRGRLLTVAARAD